MHNIEIGHRTCSPTFIDSGFTERALRVVSIKTTLAKLLHHRSHFDAVGGRPGPGLSNLNPSVAGTLNKVES